MHAAPLTPQMGALLQRIRRAARPAFHTLTPLQARAAYAAGAEVPALARVHAPIGLDIGAVTPNEIAISIMAELIAIHRNAGEHVGRSMKVPTERLDKWLARM